MGLLDFLFPKYCVNCKKLGDYLCSNCFSYISFDTPRICLVCNRPAVDGLTHPGCRGRYAIDGAFTAIAYKGVVKKLLYQFKYKPYIASLTNTLVDLFFESLIQQEMFDKAYQTKPIIVPIPLHASKLKARGYNQANLLAKGLARKLDLPVIELLIRARKTRSQYGLKQKERKANIRGAFSLSPNVLISQYPDIFLVDDILTTGSTLVEAARILKRAGVKKVWGLALAKD